MDCSRVFLTSGCTGRQRPDVMWHLKIHTTSLIHWVRVVQQYRVAVTSFGLLPRRSGRHQDCLLSTLQILFTRYLVFSNNLVPSFTTLSLARCKVRVTSEWWTAHDLEVVAAKQSGIFLHVLSTFLSNKRRFQKQHFFLKGPQSIHVCRFGMSNRQMKMS